MGGGGLKGSGVSVCFLFLWIQHYYSSLFVIVYLAFSLLKFCLWDCGGSSTNTFNKLSSVFSLLSVAGIVQEKTLVSLRGSLCGPSGKVVQFLADIKKCECV